MIHDPWIFNNGEKLQKSSTYSLDNECGVVSHDMDTIKVYAVYVIPQIQISLGFEQTLFLTRYDSFRLTLRQQLKDVLNVIEDYRQSLVSEEEVVYDEHATCVQIKRPTVATNKTFRQKQKEENGFGSFGKTIKRSQAKTHQQKVCLERYHEKTKTSRIGKPIELRYEKFKKKKKKKTIKNHPMKFRNR